MDSVEFSYGSKPVLKGVDLELDPSEILGILGPNGSGKTTMMRCINCILEPQQGHVLLDGEDVRSLPRLEMARRMGYVPQNKVDSMTAPTVYEVVLMGRRPHIKWEYGQKDRDIAWAAMEEMNVKDLAAEDFSSLSSGQTQRVLMARAIAQEADILLLDEPTSNLDVKYQLEVMNTVKDLVGSRGIGAIAIIHDLDLAMRYCDKAVILDGGVIVAAGKTEDVITPKIVKEVYGVDVIIDRNYGRPRVIVL
ncbi:ABC transporter ATP-binding protein [Methanomassiliicoccales archaeon LGM-DZ1]|nr:ABC transporter ATP-binding protein [Methanomassiliicoccales archaeon LGM-DZ1]